MRLVTCGDCERHVRDLEATCPFCGAAIDAPPAGPARPLGRLGRAALFAFGTSLAVAGCGDEIDPPAPAYGTPPIDAGPGDADAGPEDAGGPVAAYGGAPVDAG